MTDLINVSRNVCRSLLLMGKKSLTIGHYPPEIACLILSDKNSKENICRLSFK